MLQTMERGKRFPQECVRAGNGSREEMPGGPVAWKDGTSPSEGVSGNLTTFAIWEGNSSTRKACVGDIGKCRESSGEREIIGVTPRSPPAAVDSLTPQGT